MRLISSAFLILLASITTLSAQSVSDSYLLNKPDSKILVTAAAETGFLYVIDHTIKSGKNGTQFNYVKEGGQDVLFPFARLSFETAFGKKKKNALVFLYQPLNIENRVRLERDVRVDDVTYASNSVLLTRYSFPFYRLSYLYSFIKKEKLEVAGGISLQIRNADIQFESGDGSNLRRTHNIGPVPILKLRAAWTPAPFSLAFEGDAFYASSKFFNGADFEFVGAVWDTSLRLGYTPRPSVDLFLNLRIFGGGALGTSEYPDSNVSDGYTKNWLNTFTLSAGCYLK